MPFFLSSKPPQKPSRAAPRAQWAAVDKTKSKANSPPRARDWTWAFAAVGMLIAIGLCAGWYAARTALREQLTQRAPAPTGAGAIRLDAFTAARWVPENEVKLLLEDMGACLSPDPLDGAGLAAAAHRLEQHPAIQDVRRIWRDDKGLVRIEALAYHPAAVVTGPSLSVVDAQGHLLAEHLAEAVADQLPIPRCEGVSTPSPYGGKEATWQDSGLQAGLHLLLRLSLDENRHIRKLYVGTRDERRRPVLAFTLQGVGPEPIDIVWGLPVGEEAGVDAAPEKKLEALRSLYRNPEVRAGRAGNRFSIRSGSAKALLESEIAPHKTSPPPPPASRTRNR